MPSIRALDVERIEEVSDVLAARMLRVTLLLHGSEDREFSIIVASTTLTDTFCRVLFYP